MKSRFISLTLLSIRAWGAESFHIGKVKVSAEFVPLENMLHNSDYKTFWSLKSCVIRKALVQKRWNGSVGIEWCHEEPAEIDARISDNYSEFKQSTIWNDIYDCHRPIVCRVDRINMIIFLHVAILLIYNTGFPSASNFKIKTIPVSHWYTLRLAECIYCTIPGNWCFWYISRAFKSYVLLLKTKYARTVL